MKNLRRLGLCLTLISFLAGAAFAGDTNSPPCASPDPGITNTPPCAAAQMTPGDYAAPDRANGTPTSNPADTTSVAEVALDLFERVLSIF